MDTLQVGHIYDIRLSKILSLSPTELRVKLLSPHNPAQQLSPLVRLDSFLPHLGCGSVQQVWELVKEFLMTSSSCTLLSDLLVSLQLGRLADRLSIVSPPGQVWQVTVCQSPSASSHHHIQQTFSSL